MKLIEYLSIPYLTEISSQVADGAWKRQAECVELPGCVSEGETVEEALSDLEVLRVQLIVNLLRNGQRPAVPRAPLAQCGSLEAMERAGIHNLDGLLQCEEDELAAMGRTDRQPWRR